MGLYAKSRDRDRWRLWPCLLLCLLVAACSRDDGARTVETLRIAVLPDQSEAKLRLKYQPLLDYIETHTGLHCELLIPESYDQLLQWFIDRQIDMARFGGVAYVKAHLQARAAALVMRDVDAHFRSVALVHADYPADSLQDLAGASLAFGDRLSTSGHFMPRYFLQQQDIIPEKYFSEVRYSGAHDRTAEWVRDGKVEAGLVNAVIVDEMFLDGRLGRENVRIIWVSPPYADYVWALQPDISKQQGILMRDAFLQMNQGAEGKLLLQELGGNYYIPAGHDDFSRLEQVILELDQQQAVP